LCVSNHHVLSKHSCYIHTTYAYTDIIFAYFNIPCVSNSLSLSHTHTHKHTHTHTHTHTNTHPQTQTHVHTQKHMHTHTHTHTLGVQRGVREGGRGAESHRNADTHAD